MKRSKILVVALIGLLMAGGLILTGCDDLVSTSTGGDNYSGGNSGNPPSAPYIVGTFTNTSTTLSWSPVSGATSYEVYTVTVGNTYTYQRIATVYITSYTHYTTLAYNYAVRAKNSYGYSEYSNYVHTY